MLDRAGISALLRDSRVQRLLVANTLGSIGSGVTIFSVPWLMVHRAGGNEAYRWITIATTVALFALMPYYGAWVDRHSRKTALLASEAWGFFATVSMAALGGVLGHFAMWQLMAVYFAGMLYYTLHYPAKFAFIQQIFDRSQYQSLTGLLEIQGQTAMMIAGGLGGVLVEHVPLWAILLFDASTYLTSFLIQATLPYEPTHLAAPRTTATHRPAVWASVAAGWNWLRERPQLNVFLTCALLPFIIVMAGNYLFPIYVTETLHANAIWFAGGEIAFACGAVLAGALLPRLIAQHTAATTIPATMFVFLAGLIAVIALRFPLTYLAAGALLGFGNAGCRVARSALLLHIVPNEVMGRVGGFYQVLDRILRTLLVMAMAVIDRHGPPAGFMILLAVLLVALFGVLQTRLALRQVETAAAAPAPA
ncbi:MAG TPA: MFS transporter [Opitutaceae bacterium]|nr:MFS transporter [Opitutaceae bacterium]